MSLLISLVVGLILGYWFYGVPELLRLRHDANAIFNNSYVNVHDLAPGRVRVSFECDKSLSRRFLIRYARLSMVMK